MNGRIKPPERRGVLIVAVGLPGSGKTAVIRELGAAHGYDLLLEPEEKDWHASVPEHDQADAFSALIWFRAVRVPQVRKADVLRRLGHTVLLDNYYDKLVHDYLGKPGMERLLAPDDPYYSVFCEMSRLDKEFLPHPDCLVFFEVEQEAWRAMLVSRDRRFDREPGFLQLFEAQAYFLDLARAYCRDQGVTFIPFPNRISTARGAGWRLYKLLRERSVLG